MPAIQPAQEPTQPVQIRVNDPTQGQSRAVYNQLLEFIQNSNQQNAASLSAASQNIAAATQNEGSAQASLRVAGGSGDGFGSLVSGIGELAKAYLDIQAQNQERQRQEAWVNANLSAEDLVSRTEDMIRGDEGFAGWQTRASELLGTYGSYLSPEQIVELNRRVYDAAQPVLSSMSNEMRDYLQSNNDAQRSIIAQEVLLTNSANLAALRNPSTPQEAMAAAAAFNESLRLSVRDLPLEDQLLVVNQLMGQLTDASLAGNVVLRDQYSRLSGFSAFLTDYAAIRDAFFAPDSEYAGNIEAYRTRIYTSAQNHGIDLSWVKEFDDPTLQQDYEYQRFTQLNNLQQSQRAAAEDNLRLVELDAEQISLLGYQFYSNPLSREAWEQYRDIPAVSQALALADAREEYDTRRASLERDRIQANQAIAALQVSDIGSAISFLNSQRASGSLERLLGVQGLFNEGLNDLLSQLETSVNTTGADSAQTRALFEQLSSVRSDMATMLQQRLESQTNEFRTWADRNVHQYGLGNPSIEQERYSQDAQAQLDTVYRSVESQLGQLRQQALPAAVNPTRPQLATGTVGETTILYPFPPGTSFTTRSNFGQRRERHTHAGEDVSLPAGTPVIAYEGGTVRVRNDPEGYGNYVDVVDARGYRHRFAHLSRTSVRDGQTIPAGTVLGHSGSTGRSTGPHLHWEVRPPGAPEFGFDGAVDPLEWAASNLTQSLGRQARGGDEVPITVPPDAVRLRTGQFIHSNQIMYPDGTSEPAEYTVENPIRNDFAPSTIDDVGEIRNDPANNFGYSIIAQDREFRIALARASSALGIPAVWLADIMAFESRGFDASARNMGGSGATGLIQFMKETAEGLGTSTSALARMTRAEQMTYVRRYLEEYRDRYDGFRSIHEVLASIWGGHRLMRQLRRAPTSRTTREWRDRDITFEEYIRRLGSHAGRQYRAPWGSRSVIHTSYTNGCAMCQSLVRSNSSILPHESQA